MSEWMKGCATATAVCSVVGMTVFWLSLPPAPRPQQLPVPGIELHARLSELEGRVEAMTKQRCFNVKTDRLDVGIYPVENLGVKR